MTAKKHCYIKMSDLITEQRQIITEKKQIFGHYILTQKKLYSFETVYTESFSLLEYLLIVLRRWVRLINMLQYLSFISNTVL